MTRKDTPTYKNGVIAKATFAVVILSAVVTITLWTVNGIMENNQRLRDLEKYQQHAEVVAAEKAVAMAAIERRLTVVETLSANVATMAATVAGLASNRTVIQNK